MAQVYPLKIKDTVFNFRGATRAELRHFQSFYTNRLEYYEHLILACILEPKITFGDPKEGFVSLDNLPFLAGDVLIIGRAIENASGFYGEEYPQLLTSQGEEYANSHEGRLDALALMAIPGLSYNELVNMDPSDTFRVYSLAMVIAPALGIDVRIILNPEEYSKEKRAMYNKEKAREATAHGQTLIGLKGQVEVEKEETFSVK